MSDKLKLTSEQFTTLHDFAIQEDENFNLGHESTTIVVQPDLREAVKSFTTIFEDVAQETSGRLSLVRQYSLLNKLRPIPRLNDFILGTLRRCRDQLIGIVICILFQPALL